MNNIKTIEQQATMIAGLLPDQPNKKEKIMLGLLEAQAETKYWTPEMFWEAVKLRKKITASGK